jgi:hypothetical protein
MASKSLDSIEKKMQDVEPGSLRYQILQNAKDFKTSWVGLGQTLYTAYKDKLYKSWGYSTFDIYTAKEIGIKKQTALKLLRSYYFLEKEEPGYLNKGYKEQAEAATVPSYESIDALRAAKDKKMLDENDYEEFKRKVFEKGKEASEIKKDLTAMIRQRKELDPQEAREQRRTAVLKRFLSTLKSLKAEIETSKLLPANIIKEANELIREIESQLT